MTNTPSPEKLKQRLLLDVLINAGLLAGLVFLCFKILSPFLSMLLWAVVLAVTLYPLHQMLANKLGGKQGRAATVMVLLGVLLIGAPMAILSTSLAESVAGMAKHVNAGTLVVPAPPAKVAEWPLVGEKIHTAWNKAATDLPALIYNNRAEIGGLLKSALGLLAQSATGLLMFLFSFAIAGVIVAYGREGAYNARRICRRFMGSDRGDGFAVLSTSTIRAVATGVIGVAFIQAVLMGLVLIIAGIPFAGALAAIALVLGIAQVPALIIALPVIAYMWTIGDYATIPAVIYSVLLLVSGMADNVLKPLLLGRGVEAPMPVILLGALGGMVSSGLLGMFLGAVMLALGYQIFMGWVAMQEPIEVAPQDAAPAAAADPAG
jgi:predicted PurR-regulated permease PerM